MKIRRLEDWKIKRLSVVAITLLAIVILISGCTNNTGYTESKGGEKTMYNRFAVFETSEGRFKAELFEDKVPATAGNFITLAQKGK